MLEEQRQVNQKDWRRSDSLLRERIGGKTVVGAPRIDDDSVGRITGVRGVKVHVINAIPRCRVADRRGKIGRLFEVDGDHGGRGGGGRMNKHQKNH